MVSAAFSNIGLVKGQQSDVCVCMCVAFFYQRVEVSAPRLPSHMWTMPDWSTVTQLSPEQV